MGITARIAIKDGSATAEQLFEEAIECEQIAKASLRGGDTASAQLYFDNCNLFLRAAAELELEAA